MPPLYRIDVGKEVYYALDDAEKKGILDRNNAEKKQPLSMCSVFKGLGEMNPLQLRETTMILILAVSFNYQSAIVIIPKN